MGLGSVQFMKIRVFLGAGGHVRACVRGCYDDGVKRLSAWHASEQMFQAVSQCTQFLFKRMSNGQSVVMDLDVTKAMCVLWFH
mmetsp:Transcript_110266/g.195207  ORF Transcript_110266/g.195207 Transcript_110266/m.195207 type:complete len:83 (+) Transcript_110266:35-283(+)